MKFLCVGCLHGNLPKKILKFVKNVDVILCSGDLPNTDFIRNFEFKNWKKITSSTVYYKLLPDKKWHKEYKNISEDTSSILKKLNSIGKQIFLITGNSDFIDNDKKILIDIVNLPKSILSVGEIIKKFKFRNIKLLKHNLVSINGITIIGNSGYRGVVSKKLSKRKDLVIRTNIEAFNRKWNIRLKRLFKKSKGTAIFFAHDPPRDTKLDIVKNKKSPMNGKHVGDEYYKRYILKYQPLIHVCAHMHENQGLDRIGKTIILNSGFGGKSQFAMFDISNNEIKNIKFYK